MTTRLLALALTLAVTSIGGPARLGAQAAPQEAPTRRPDVIFVPTPEEVVEAMLQVASVNKNDIVYDLGCGDGRIPVTAAKKYGARGVCVDIDPQRIKEATENVAKNGVGDKVRLMNADPDERAAPWHAHRVARVRHGRLETREGNRRRRSQGVLLDDPETLSCAATFSFSRFSSQFSA
jgi:16S rRNA G966 N2-methylase RsmD